jgi:hypothetical protein
LSAHLEPNPDQGDQIGRISAYWMIAYFWVAFVKIAELAQFFFSAVKVK